MSRFNQIRQSLMNQDNQSPDLSSMNAFLASSNDALNYARERGKSFSDALSSLNSEQSANKENGNPKLTSITGNSTSNNNPSIAMGALNPGNTVYNNNNSNSNYVPEGLAGLLAKHEGAGNYDTLFGHSQREGGRFANIRVSDMTIDELRQFSNPNGEYGQWVKSSLEKSGQKARVATPMGAGQIVGSTLDRTAKQMGLSGDTKFDAQTQSNMINYLAMNRINNSKNMNQAISGLRQEWEGFKNVSDQQLIPIIRHMSNGRL